MREEEHLDGRVPLLGAGRFVHVVVRLRWDKLLCGHHDSSIFRLFQLGSFFSRAFIAPSHLNRSKSFDVRLIIADHVNRFDQLVPLSRLSRHGYFYLQRDTRKKRRWRNQFCPSTIKASSDYTPSLCSAHAPLMAAQMSDCLKNTPD